MSQERINRVNELIRTTLPKFILDALELEEGTFVTITRVETSRDLAHANVMVTIFPDNAREDLFIRLTHIAPKLRHGLSQETKLQKVPELHFRYDETERYASHMDKILDSLEGPSP